MVLPKWNELSPLIKRSPRKRWALIRAELAEISDETYDVSVTTTDGTNVLGAVQVTLTKGTKIIKGKTGSKGNCNLNDVPAGTYNVNAVKEGYSYTETTLEVTENQSIELSLTEDEDEDSGPEGSPENTD